jgi:hypothetical protein
MRVSNDYADMKNEEDEIIALEVRDKEQSVARSGRTVKKPAYPEHYVPSAMSCSDDIPQSYSEMEGRNDRMKWRKTIKRKARKQSLENNRFT